MNATRSPLPPGRVPVLLALALTLHAGAPVATAADPALPKPLVFKSTVAITQIDFAALDAMSLQSTAESLGLAALPEVKGRIAKFSTMRKEFLRLCHPVLTAVILDRNKGRPEMFMTASPREGASEEDLNQWMKGQMDLNRLPGTRAGYAFFTPRRSQEPPAEGSEDPARHALFARALASGSGPDPAIRSAFIPTATLRAQVEEELREEGGRNPVIAIIEPVLSSRLVTLRMTPGTNPTLDFQADFGNADEAGKMTKIVNGLIAMGTLSLSREISKLDTAPAAKATEALTRLAQDLKMKPEGMSAVLRVDGRVLSLATAALGPAIENARNRAFQARDMSRMRQVLVAIQIYRMDYNKYPDDLGQLAGDNPKQAKYLGENFSLDGFIYKAPAGDDDPASTAILWRSVNGKPDPEGPVGYLDGHVERP